MVEIKCTLIPGAENVLEIPTFIRAKIYKPIVKNGIFSKNKVTHKWDDCTIISASLKQMVIRSSRIMCEYEDMLKIRIGSPIFSKESDINLQLAQNGLMFGKSTKYVYRITRLKEKEQTELADFIKLGSLELIKYLH